jgi:hypothetical protein
MKTIIIFSCLLFTSIQAHADPSGGGTWTVYDERLLDAGDNETSATDLSLSGFMIRPVRVLGSLGAEESDWFRMQLDTVSHVGLTAVPIRENASLQIELVGGEWSRDVEAEYFYESRLRGRFLRPGVYYIKVKNLSAVDTFYNLVISGQPNQFLPEDMAGQTPETALALPPLVNFADEVTHEGWVEPEADPSDYFLVEYQGTEPRELIITLDGMEADVDLALLTLDRRTLQESYNGGVDAEGIQRVIAPGSYLIMVFPAGAESKYRLNIRLGEVGVLPPPPTGRDREEGDERDMHDGEEGRPPSPSIFTPR